MTTKTFVDRDLEVELDSVFSRLFDIPVLTAAEAAGNTEANWSSITALGLHGIAIEEDRGGSGGALPQLVALMRSGGRYGVPIPLVENHLAAWLLTTAGDDMPTGISTVIAPQDSDSLDLVDGRVVGVAHHVPWAPVADRIVGIVTGRHAGAELVCLQPDQVRLGTGTDLAGQPRATLTVTEKAPRRIPSRHTVRDLQYRAALLRSAQMSGAIERVAADTLEYVRTRKQFGASIGSFQAVQQHIVVLHQASAMTSMCVERAAAAAFAGAGRQEAEAAYLVASHNAAIAVRAAHQAHGAIGMTKEFSLHHFTRRLQQWRRDLVSPQQWAVSLGRRVCDAGSVRDVVTAACGAGAGHE